MSLNNKKIYLLIVLGVQIAFFTGWYAVNSYALSDRDARSIMLQTRPVDPRDMISGNYFILHYDFSIINSDTKQINYNEKQNQVYIVLHKVGSFYQEQYITSYKPHNLTADQIFIKGRVEQGYFTRININAEKYFINENFPAPKFKDAVTVQLKVNKYGHAMIEKVFINDKAI